MCWLLVLVVGQGGGLTVLVDEVLVQRLVPGLLAGQDLLLRTTRHGLLNITHKQGRDRSVNAPHMPYCLCMLLVRPSPCPAWTYRLHGGVALEAASASQVVGRERVQLHRAHAITVEYGSVRMSRPYSPAPKILTMSSMESDLTASCFFFLFLRGSSASSLPHQHPQAATSVIRNLVAQAGRPDGRGRHLRT